MTRRLLACLLIAGSLACGGSITGASRTVALGQEFELRVGESALLSDELLALTFDRVLSDSRCPLDVFCIQAGDAVLQITARRLPKAQSALTLHTELARSSAGFQGYTILLVELNPHPKAGEAIAPGEYAATLVVTRP